MARVLSDVTLDVQNSGVAGLPSVVKMSPVMPVALFEITMTTSSGRSLTPNGTAAELWNGLKAPVRKLLIVVALSSLSRKWPSLSMPTAKDWTDTLQLLLAAADVALETWLGGCDCTAVAPSHFAVLRPSLDPFDADERQQGDEVLAASLVDVDAVESGRGSSVAPRLLLVGSASASRPKSSFLITGT